MSGAAPAVSLRPVSRDEHGLVRGIVGRPGQEIYAGSVDAAFAGDGEDVDFHAVLTDRPVGFFKIDRAYHRRLGYAPRGALGLRGFLIDAGAQGCGIGSAAMAALRGYLAERYPGAGSVWLVVSTGHRAAVTAYERGGFEKTGQIWRYSSLGPQFVMRMGLSSPGGGGVG